MKKTTKHTLLSVLTILLALTVRLQAGIGSGESQEGPLPVELTSFSVTVNGVATGAATIVINWTTATEVNNYGFEIERALIRSEERNHLVPDEWETIGFVNGHGNSNSPKDYSFVDSKLLRGAVRYRLKQIDTDGKFKYSSVIELRGNLLQEYVLDQNYPNPFNPTTEISYYIPKESNVSIKVFDVLGNTIATLANQHQAIGSYKVNFDASALSNGVYFYKMKAGEFTSVKKMLLIK